jgi:hypothetical protein
MKQISQKELEDVFIDVRKAYRLLYFYQRRIMDTIEFISTTLSRNIYSGYSLFSDNAPRNGSKLKLDRWSWDWLSMYFYEFYFEEEKSGDDTYKLAISVQADNGYYKINKGISRTDVDQFAAVDVSASKIYFFIAKNTWKPNDFDDTWDTDARTEIKFGNQKELFIAKVFNLSSFNTEENILDNLKELNTFCINNGIKSLLK